ncbi:MAG: SpoIIE family protein phosphatase [Clostridia bacterium]|nr:SpoIIE family protein phosphatase [Clostridia bacterium]
MKRKSTKFITKIAVFLSETAVFFALSYKKIPLSSALYAALISCGTGIVAPSIALVASSVIYKSSVMFTNALVTTAVMIIASCVYKKLNKRVGAESVISVFASQIVYVAFFDLPILNKLLYTAIITLFYFVSTVAVATAVNKKFSAMPTVAECASVIAVYTAFGCGAIELVGEAPLKAVAIFLILFAAKLYKSPSALAAAVFAALPFCIYTGDLGYVALYSAIFFAAFLFNGYVGILSALAVVAVDVIFAFFIRFYAVYGYIEALLAVVPAFVFAVIPTATFEKLIGASYLGGEKLTRKTIARVSSRLSGKIYDLAEAFSETEASLSALSLHSEIRRATVRKINKAACESACDKCSSVKYCQLSASERCERLVDLAIAKGRLTLVDLPKDFLDKCVNPNPLIYEINKLTERYSAENERLKRSDEVKKIISLYALGANETLSQLACSLNCAVDSDETEERKLTKFLARRGKKTFGVMVSGTGNAVISMILPESVPDEEILSDVAEYADHPAYVSDKQKIRDDLKYVELKRAPAINAAFGVSSVTKDGSKNSGDVHSIMDLGDGRYLIALSDGMGSGETALSTSTATIGLIEGLLKAGMKSSVVLPLVNEMISVSTEDNFSAVDIGIVDLFNGSCDFIKIGAPYGFILSPEGIRFIEGSSLPIGILSELRPTTAHAGVKSGDMIIMISDGVTDAFGSSTDFIEYLKTAPARNPQALADDVIKKALELTVNVAEDDMTCFCVRLFDRAA